MGRRPEAGMLLLRDLRELYLKACGVSADWELLAQAAQGIKHRDLLALAQKCHPQTIRQMKWANGKAEGIRHPDPGQLIRRTASSQHRHAGRRP